MRSHQRVNFDQVVKYAPLSIDPAGERLGSDGEGKNLSFTGIYFETKRTSEILSHLKVGNLIWVGFTLPVEPNLIRIQCEVRRVLDLPKERLGFGVMFINLSQRLEKMIMKYISDNDKAEAVAHRPG
jgi:c-di-GMP-binding flagellar brake protein YcgR